MYADINKKRVVAYGFLTWLVPFAASFLFFGRSGHPVLPIGLIKLERVWVEFCCSACSKNSQLL
jgi:hypothetical protein